MNEEYRCTVGVADSTPEEWEAVKDKTRILIDGQQVKLRSVTGGTGTSIEPLYDFDFYYSIIIILHDILGNDGHEIPESAELITHDNVIPFIWDSIKASESAQDALNMYLEFAVLATMPAPKKGFSELLTNPFTKKEKIEIVWILTDVTEISRVDEGTVKISGKCRKA